MGRGEGGIKGDVSKMCIVVWSCGVMQCCSFVSIESISDEPLSMSAYLFNTTSLRHAAVTRIRSHPLIITAPRTAPMTMSQSQQPVMEAQE